MRRLVIAIAFAAVALAPFAACGGGPTKPPTAPEGSGNNGPDSSIANAPASGEASSTTTQTLGDGGDLDAGQPLPGVAAPGATVSTEAGAMIIMGDGGSARRIDDLNALVLARRPQIRACYDQARKQHPELSGKFNIQITLDPKGVVQDVQSGADSDITDPGMLACTADIIKKIPFGPNPAGRNTIYNYRYKFTPNGG